MLKEIKLSDLNINPFQLIGKDWMLITAGDKQAHNTMTASWGGLGVLWGKDVSFIVVRPQRFTLEFIDEQPYYSLCFFGPEQKAALSYCGSHSGRDVDKAKETGLIPVFTDQAPYYQQAKLVLICKKLSKQPIDPSSFFDPEIGEKWYPGKDYHNCIVGEIVKILSDE